MKSFLLTLEYPFTGHEKIDFRRISARNAESALNKARKLVKRIYAGGGYGGVKILHCEEITSCAEFWMRKKIVDAEIEAMQEKLVALSVEARALNCIASSLSED